MEECIIQTQIDPRFKKRALFKAFFLSLLGALPILIAATQLPPRQLPLIGLPIFFAGLLLIKAGLGSYRKLTMQELFPNELIFNKKAMVYRVRGKNLFSVPIALIDSILFFKTRRIYGLSIYLNVPFSEKIMIHHPDFKLLKFHQNSKNYGCDLFFPFFYEKTFHRLKEFEPLAAQNALKERI